ncbi:uncharacterized protein METZ01_LOCUS508301 [marine metagenome]|uniref:Uncharacterized protein n=1 Tax=marine metagenome TaxID=408172 RepID=A0A383EF28_9ZZZZ
MAKLRVVYDVLYDLPEGLEINQLIIQGDPV